MILDEVYDFFRTLPDARLSVEEIVVNAGFTGVLLEDGRAGVAMNIRSANTVTEAGLESLRRRVGHNAMELADEVFGSDRLACSAGVASLSALSQPYLNEAFLAPHGLTVKAAGFDRILAEDIPPESTVGMVGFGGTVKGVSEKAKRVIVTELEPQLFRSFVLDREGITIGPTNVSLVSAVDGETQLSCADVVLITGCALVSQSMDALLDACRKPKVIIYGASASILPMPFFRHLQVAKVTTIRVTDGPKLMKVLANGGPQVERFFQEASENITIGRS